MPQAGDLWEDPTRVCRGQQAMRILRSPLVGRVCALPPSLCSPAGKGAGRGPVQVGVRENCRPSHLLHLWRREGCQDGDATSGKGDCHIIPVSTDGRPVVHPQSHQELGDRLCSGHPNSDCPPTVCCCQDLHPGPGPWDAHHQTVTIPYKHTTL